jgi:hypothetical protein
MAALVRTLQQDGVLDDIGKLYGIARVAADTMVLSTSLGSLDVMVAMKKFSQASIEKAIRSLEAEVGIEVRFAAMSSEDLMYRVGMYDKLTRDFFDYSHQVLVDKIGVKDEVTSSSYRM